MSVQPRAAWVVGLVAAAVAAGGCGSDRDRDDARLPEGALRVYSSLPLTGALAPVAREVRRGEELALREAGRRIGGRPVTLVVLDAARGGPQSNPAYVSANARRAARDRSTLAYLGELEPGASAVSMRFSSAAGILQVSPRDTAAALTDPDQRERYQPGDPTFARVAGSDAAEVDAIAAAAGGDRLRTVVVAADATPTSTGLAQRVADRLDDDGRVVGPLALAGSGDPRTLAEAVREGPADAVVYTGAPTAIAVRGLRAAAAAAPGLTIIATDRMALEPRTLAGLDATTRTLVAAPVPGRPPPGLAGRYRQLFGRAPPAAAIFGYAAMRLVIDAGRDAGDELTRRRLTAEALRRAGDAQPPAVRLRRFDAGRPRTPTTAPRGGP